MKLLTLFIFLTLILICESSCGGGGTTGCLNGGNCNSSNNKCECTNQWTGNNCETKKIQVYSIFPSYSSGGEVIMYGSFLANSQITTITIGTLPCILNFITTDQISCNVGAGTGIKDISIIQTGSTNWFAPNSYEYIIRPTPTPCPSNFDCNNRGYCNQYGYCTCESGFYGNNCQYKY